MGRSVPPAERGKRLKAVASLSMSQDSFPDSDEITYLSRETLRLAWIILGVAFAVEVVMIKLAGPELQGASYVLTEHYQRVFDSEAFEDFSDFLHHNVSSRALLLLASLIYWAVDPFEGSNLYCLTSIGFALKVCVCGYI